MGNDSRSSAAGVANTVGRGPVPATGHALEHVAEVDDEGAVDRGRGDPTARTSHLEPPERVLRQDRDEPVVGVLADAPSFVDARRAAGSGRCGTARAARP